MKNKPKFRHLMLFLSKSRDEGAIPESTAASMRSSIKRLSEVMTLDELEDVRKINPSEIAYRFRRRNPDVGRSSVKTYQSRLANAIEMYTSEYGNLWDDESADQENGTSAADRPSQNQNLRYLSRPVMAEELSYPFPLRPDITVKISNLPRDLKTAEVERIAAFLRSLAEDFSP